MAEALYRKYRPNTFDDVVGQEHIERTLKNAIEQDKISHAYLFCGPRGTGKTTMARILAKALLCEKGPTIEPDGTCEECLEIAAGTHPDVYELDAASRTGVENVREEIINRVHYAPTRGSYKIYIIDEVHMLSTAAFNALLKTLEEPPSHVVFILCTTDPQKVPDTIHSRCQRFDFHRLSVDEIVARLGAVCVQEDVEFEAEALELIAHQAEGGMRNALTSLEQLAAFGEGRVTLDGAHRILGSLDNEDLSEIVQALGKRDAATCFTWVSDYVETGADIAQFVHDLAEHFRNLYLMSLTDADVEIAVSSSTRASMEQELELFGTERLSRALSVLGELMKELRATSNSRLTFEIALTRLLRPDSELTLESLAERLEELELKMLSMPAAISAVPAFDPSVPEQPTPAAPPRTAAVMQSAPASAPRPAPAPQSAPMPQPAPAPRSVPAPDPTPIPSAVPAPEPHAVAQDAQHAPSPAVSSASPAAPSAPGVPAAPAAFDYSDPAALQRMWSAVTTSLRKSNPARGVLFMGAKIEPNAQGEGVNIVFSPDSSFAYSAAQKKDVRDLLAQTFVTVAGGAVPFQIIMSDAQGQARPAAPASPQRPVAPQQPNAPEPVATPLMEAQSVAAPQASSAPTFDPLAASSPAPTPVSAPAAPSQPAPSQASASQRPTSDMQQADPLQPVDQRPAVPQWPAPQQPVASEPAPPRAAAPEQPVPGVQPAVPSQPAPMPTASDDNESEQLKQIITGAFGDGVKFDTM